MKTLILPMCSENIKLAARLLKNGELVAIPTETVYGLAGNALSPEAVRKIFEVKGRPCDNPLILHISNINCVYEYAKEVSELAIKLARKFWPGPLTMIFQKKDSVPLETSGGLDTAAFRMPDNKLTLALIDACGFPLAAPSANLSGLPSPTGAEHVYSDMKNKIPIILDGGPCSCGIESTVISFIEKGVKILRPGAITFEMLSEFCEVEIDKAVITEPSDDERVSSPGMKYKHYSPRAEVYLIEFEDRKSLSDFINQNSDDSTYALVSDISNIKIKTLPYGEKEQTKARELFSSLRKADEAGATKIYVEAPKKEGIGLAVYNRLIRAAAFKIIKL